MEHHQSNQGQSRGSCPTCFESRWATAPQPPPPRISPTVILKQYVFVPLEKNARGATALLVFSFLVVNI